MAHRPDGLPAHDCAMEVLVHQIVECDRLFAADAPRRWLRPQRRAAAWFIPVAAAVALTMMLHLPGEPRVFIEVSPAMDAVAVSLQHLPCSACPAHQRVDTFRSCADEQSYAMVLFRAWSDDLRALTWRVHQFEDGSLTTRLSADDSVSVPLDVSDAPPLAQDILLAVARRRTDLPDDARSADDLLLCLNESLPPSSDELMGGARSGAVLASCLPAPVTVVQRSFHIDTPGH